MLEGENMVDPKMMIDTISTNDCEHLNLWIIRPTVVVLWIFKKTIPIKVCRDCGWWEVVGQC